MNSRQIDAARVIGLREKITVSNSNDQGAEVSGIAAGAMTGAVQGAHPSVNSAEEHAFWRQHYRELAAYQDAADYERIAPAFEFGWQRRQVHRDTTFEAGEVDLMADWQRQAAAGNLPWDMARQAVQAAWNRIDQAVGGETKPSAR
jgi:hypothetical protein